MTRRLLEAYRRRLALDGGAVREVSVALNGRDFVTAEARRVAGCPQQLDANESARRLSEAGPCDAVCPQGICDSMLDASKPECAECLACEMAQGQERRWRQ